MSMNIRKFIRVLLFSLGIFTIVSIANAGVAVNLFDMPLMLKTSRVYVTGNKRMVVPVRVKRMSDVNQVIAKLQRNKKIILNIDTNNLRTLNFLQNAIVASVKVSNRGAIIGMLAPRALLPTDVRGYEKLADIYHAAERERFPVFFLSMPMNKAGLRIFTRHLTKLRGYNAIRFVGRPVILGSLFLRSLRHLKATDWKLLVDISHNLVVPKGSAIQENPRAFMALLNGVAMGAKDTKEQVTVTVQPDMKNISMHHLHDTLKASGGYLGLILKAKNESTKKAFSHLRICEKMPVKADLLLTVNNGGVLKGTVFTPNRVGRMDEVR